MNITVDLAIIAATIGIIGWGSQVISRLFGVIRSFENELRDQKAYARMLEYRVKQLEGFNAGQGYNRRRLSQDPTGAPWVNDEG